jgi:uncharacterized protein YndB with AHSA1/START domain
MTKTGTFQVTTPSDREIAMTRVFSAPRQLVFEALTRPELVSQWLLGPPGWTMPVCEIDLRVGGKYRYVWRNQNGKEMASGGEFQEIAPPERLVASERFEDPWYPGEGVATWLLTEAGGETTLTLTMLYDSQQTRDMALKSGMEKGVAISFDRLEELVSGGGRE